MGGYKIATGIGTVALLSCFALGAGFAAPKNGGGGHPAGGGGHPAGGGGGHPSFGGGHPAAGGAHINVGRSAAVTHFTAPRGGHITAHVATHVATHVGRPSYRGAPHPRTRTNVVRRGRGTGTAIHANNPASGNAAHNTARGNTARNGALHTPVSHAAAISPRTFAAHRSFAGAAALRPFLSGRWHDHHHLGWVGPLFWPYAYGDFFYDALWPGDYDSSDPFWAYGYGDIYEGIFSPYNYDEYVQGPRAPTRMTALTESVAQSCTDESAEVTGWPISQIQAAVQPNAQQNALLDDLGNAVVKASDVVKSHCPTNVAFTPTGRLAAMQERLEGMVQAVNLVQPPLAKFYDALSDEQKARFNDIGAPSGKRRVQGQNPQSQCGENAMAWPNDQIDRAVQPNDAQRPKLEALQAATVQAAGLIKAACPTQLPDTPPSRLGAEGKRLQAMLAAVQTVRPALEAFYNSLSDDQKARFNTVGRQLFAQR